MAKKPVAVANKADATTAAAPPAAAGSSGQVSIITLKGTDAMRDWLVGASKKTHIPSATIVRLGLRAWAAEHGIEAPPEK